MAAAFTAREGSTRAPRALRGAGIGVRRPGRALTMAVPVAVRGNDGDAASGSSRRPNENAGAADWSIPYFALRPLFGHLLWGVITGTVFYALVDY
mgnify:CR=1 FL=1